MVPDFSHQMAAGQHNRRLVGERRAVAGLHHHTGNLIQQIGHIFLVQQPGAAVGRVAGDNVQELQRLGVQPRATSSMASMPAPASARLLVLTAGR